MLPNLERLSLSTGPKRTLDPDSDDDVGDVELTSDDDWVGRGGRKPPPKRGLFTPWFDDGDKPQLYNELLDRKHKFEIKVDTDTYWLNTWSAGVKQYLTNDDIGLKGLADALLPDRIHDYSTTAELFVSAIKHAPFDIKFVSEPENLDNFVHPVQEDGGGLHPFSGTHLQLFASTAISAFFTDDGGTEAVAPALRSLGEFNYRSVRVHFERMTSQAVQQGPWGLFPNDGREDINSYNVENGITNQTSDYVFRSFIANSAGEMLDKESEGYGSLVFKRPIPRLSKDSLQAWAAAAAPYMASLAAVEQLSTLEWMRALQKLALTVSVQDGHDGTKIEQASNRTVVQRRLRAQRSHPWVVSVTFELDVPWKHIRETEFVVTKNYGPTTGGNWNLWDENQFTMRSSKWNNLLYEDRQDPKVITSLKNPTFATNFAKSQRVEKKIRLKDPNFEMVLTASLLKSPLGEDWNDKPLSLYKVKIVGAWGRGNACVEVDVNESEYKFYIDRLFYNLSPDFRDTCMISMGSGETAVGSGSAVIRTLVSMASSLGFRKMTLQDASSFFDPFTAPIFAIDNNAMTHYLRLMRGYGFYEGHGFFKKTPTLTPKEAAEVETGLLEYHHLCFTTPISTMKENMKPTGVPAVRPKPFDLPDGVLEYMVANSIGAIKTLVQTAPVALHRFSFREIVLGVATEFELLRKTLSDLDSGTALSTYLALWQAIGRNKVHNYGYAQKIVKSLSSICVGETEYKSLFTSLENDVSVGKHYVVEPGQDGAAPKVVEKSIPVEFDLSSTPAK